MSVEQSPTGTVINVSNSEGIINETDETANSEIETYPNGDESNGGSALDDNAQSTVPTDVAIAAIEAERDVTLAEIHSDVERERIERSETIADSLEIRDRELEECRNQITQLTERVEALALLIPPLVSEVVEETMTEQLETVPEMNLTEPSIAAPTAELVTDDLERNEEESPVEEIAEPVRKFIAI